LSVRKISESLNGGSYTIGHIEWFREVLSCPFVGEHNVYVGFYANIRNKNSAKHKDLLMIHITGFKKEGFLQTKLFLNCQEFSGKNITNNMR
jgi:hypothetical protein